MKGHVRVLTVSLITLLCTAAPIAWQQRGATTTTTKPKPVGPVPWPDDQTMADRKRSAENRRLFSSDAALPITLTANFKQIQGDRNPESTKTFPATLEFTGDDGKAKTITLQTRMRGHARRQICSFPPLRLELPKEQTKGTVFEGHGALKLGTHCRNDIEEYVMREYAAYRIYNLLTPKSFRARLAKVTYVDAVTKRTAAVRYGMFIEDDDDVAKRLEGRISELERLTFQLVDMDTITLMTVFEYMIGNTDMSLAALHNVQVVQTRDGKRWPIAYDFDYSGLVDAQYAVPGPGLGLVTVRDRLYRGPCHTAEEFEPFFEKTRAIKPTITAMYDSLPDMTPQYRQNAKNYLEQYYRTISRPIEVKKAFIDDCRGRPYMN